ncbi:MAG: phage holin family protein [Ferruginibacter sp.]|nr:phage holin family protein [Cytophagales bacterium]
MNFLIKILLGGAAVFIGDYLISGVSVTGYGTALLVALILSLLNATVKPVLTLLTIPVTILTLGLFLLVINVLMIYLTDALISGFRVNGFFPALLFSFVLSFVNWLFDSLLD